jgi:cytochrome c oxidase subunit II
VSGFVGFLSGLSRITVRLQSDCCPESIGNAVRLARNAQRGQCAEFCGLQHAHMGLIVVVESPADFARWRDQQRAAAYPVAGLDAQAGMAVFFAHSCNICHAIRGTSAAGQVGPDLTHLASRQWLGAATLPMSRAALARWIKDPQIVKPGVHMPAIALANAEFEHLLSYLEGLK